MKCPNCGFNAEQGSFCPICGAGLSQQSAGYQAPFQPVQPPAGYSAQPPVSYAAQPAQNSRVKKGISPLALVIIIMVLLVILAGIAITIYSAVFYGKSAFEAFYPEAVDYGAVLPLINH